MRPSRHDSRGPFSFFKCPRPIALQEARERAVGEDPSLRLAARAVVALVLGVDDPLHGCEADRARLAELSMDRKAGAERSDLARSREAAG